MNVILLYILISDAITKKDILLPRQASSHLGPVSINLHCYVNCVAFKKLP